MIAQVGVLLELRVVEALAAVEDARLARLRGEPSERAHDGVAHPAALPTGDPRRHRPVADVGRGREHDHRRVGGGGHVADRGLLLPAKHITEHFVIVEKNLGNLI